MGYPVFRVFLISCLLYFTKLLNVQSICRQWIFLLLYSTLLHIGTIYMLTTLFCWSFFITSFSVQIFSERRGQWRAATQSQEFFRTLQRYYSNAYMDAVKQDAINVYVLQSCIFLLLRGSRFFHSSLQSLHVLLFSGIQQLCHAIFAASSFIIYFLFSKIHLGS